jgi:CxxC motif-containing protein (DUF1111 family)
MRTVRAIAASAALTAICFAAWQSGAATTSLRETLLAMPVSDQLGGATTRALTAPNAFSFQAANAPRQHQRPFSFGNRLFNTNWVEAPASVKSFDGLGPTFNRVSCSGCHTKDGRGQPPANGHGPMDSMLFRFNAEGYGDQLNERAVQGVKPEGQALITYREIKGLYADGETYSLRQPGYAIAAPAFGVIDKTIAISARVAPQMIGLGLLEAVPDDTLLALADENDADGDGISGRVNLAQNRIGRFGWKANQPDLLNQNAAAARGDIGLTTSIHPKENCAPVQAACSQVQSGGEPELSDEFLKKLTLYTATLAVPAQRDATDQQVVRGQSLFRNMGCAACHMPTLQTGKSPHPELSNQTIHPYTDLLLHDIGEGLADNRPDGEATGREWRTPPLWGLGLVPTVNGHTTLLHDGRARGFAEAILWHGGEAENARERFRSAPEDSRDALIAFLQSL